MKKIIAKFKKIPKKTKVIILIICLIIAIIIIALMLKPKKNLVNNNPETPNVIEEQIPKLTIIDPESNTRSFAVMINNHPQARLHHAGLQDAYIIYEIIVEGGLTRYLAVFKDQTTTKIGSVRSARHYFLDYALENDAIYVHWGWSPQAQSDISSLGINNINGLAYEGKYFYRDKSLNVSTEHTGFTTMEMLNNAASKLKYRTTSDSKTLLNYQVNPIDLSTNENAQICNNLTIRYSNSVTDKYVYDSNTQTYKRYVNDKAHIDDVTKNQYTFKNIITYQVDNTNISGDNKGRQELSNIGSGEGYYISNGYAIKIKWSKESRSAKTVYTKLDGTPLEVNDGNTFIQIQPKNQKLTISE